MEKLSPCKVNLLLNILGKRPDGYHALETILQPIAWSDRLTFEPASEDVVMTCDTPGLPVDGRNLVVRAALAFYQAAQLKPGVRIHLEKRIPMAAGLGGGSGNAATTLLALNEMAGQPLSHSQLHELAAGLGSDIPFFLQSHPALGVGRGEQIRPLEPFTALRGAWALLVHPGFGVSTAWAYQELARYPEALNGRAGRAEALIGLLNQPSLAKAGAAFYNSLEAPVFPKYPLLAVFRDFLHEHGAAVAMMSGSGSTVFALTESQSRAEQLLESLKTKFGANYWTALVAL